MLGDGGEEDGFIDSGIYFLCMCVFSGLSAGSY